jgi:anaphase-promoting complex subunit 6
MNEEAIVTLRKLAQDCLGKHMYEAAIFYGDKLIALTNGSEKDVYLLANAYFISGQHRRCLHLLQTADVIDKDYRFRHLAALCLIECKEWEECLGVLGGLECDTLTDLPFPLPPLSQGTVSHLSSLCFLRGKVYDAMENFQKATAWYTYAVEADSFNVEAFQALMKGHKLTNKQEIETLEKVEKTIPLDQSWLKLLYRSMCKKYEKVDDIEAALDELENQPVNAVTTTTDDNYMAISPDKNQLQLNNVHWDFSNSADVIAARAELLLQRGAQAKCYALTSVALERDPYALEVLPAHLVASVELRKKNELFLLGHRLVEEHPEMAMAWYAVGCYYVSTSQHDAARRYFAKATSIDKKDAAAWLAFGHSFAAQDESDQAMAAYRTAARLFPGLQGPVLGMGMEYSRMNNLGLAAQMFNQASRLCPNDPHAANEYGVLLLRQKAPEKSVEVFEKALALVKAVSSDGSIPRTWEPVLVNLGHAYRKLQNYDAAVQVLNQALGLCPGQSGTHAALGYTFHLAGEMSTAIEHYHTALGLKPEDAFVTDMLTIAMQEDAVRYFNEDLIES